MKKKALALPALFFLVLAAVFGDEMEVVDLEEFLGGDEPESASGPAPAPTHRARANGPVEEITGDREIDRLIADAKAAHDIFYDKDSAQESKDERFLYYIEYTDGLSEAAALARKRYGQESLELAQVHAARGSYFFGETLELLEAHKILEKLKGRVDAGKELDLAIRLGDGLADNFRDRAERCFLRAEELLAGGSLGERPLLSKVYDSLGRLSADKDKALDYLTRAKNIAEECIREHGAEQKPDQIPILCSALENLGRNYGKTGDYEKELLYYEDALHVLEESKRERMLPQILARLGLLHGDRGDYKKAEELLARGLEIAENSIDEDFGGASAVTGKFKSGKYSQGAYECLKGLGIVCRKTGRLDEAREHLGRMQVIAMLQGKTDYEADFFLNLADLDEECGDYEKAARDFDTAQGLLERMYGNDSPELSDALRRRAYFHERRGDFSKAKKYFMEELRVLQNSNECGDILKSCWTNIKEKLAKKEGNWTLLVESSFQGAADAVERLRTSPYAGPVKNKILAMAAPFYYMGIDSELKKAGGMERTFGYSEGVRSRGFLDQVGTEAALRLRGIPSGDAAALRLLDQRLSALREELAAILLTETGRRDNKRLSALAREMEEGQTALARQEEKMAAQNPMFAQLRNPKPAALSQAQGFCGKDKAIVEFVIWHETYADSINSLIQDKSPVRLGSYAIVITRNDAFAVRLDDFDYEGATESIREKVFDLRPEAEFEQERNRLYDALFGKIAGRLPESVKSLLIVPDGGLAFLPFDILRASGDSPELGEMYELSFSPSVSISILMASQGTGKNGSMLAAGGAWYDAAISAEQHRRAFSAESRGTTSRAARVQKKDSRLPETAELDELQTRDFISRHGAAAYFKDINLAWNDLPGTLTEIESIERTRPLESIKQESVTEERIKSLSASGRLAQYGQLHFACHGRFDEKVPEMSGIVFSEVSQRDANEDGYLVIPEILQLNLDSDFVCLSACETGRGRIRIGDGLTGLSRAFMVSGARKVGVTLWCVDDAATCDFMIRLYKKIGEGLPYSAAYRQVRGEFRSHAKEEWRHPYYRSAFVLYE